MRVLLRWLLRTVLRLSVVGDVRAVQGGRKLIVANHESLLDGAFLATILPGPLTVVVTPAALRHPLIRLCGSFARFVALDSKEPLEVKRLIRQVQNGGTVAIFPQGRVSTTGALMKVYDSAAVIAARSDALIVPVHISGSLYTHLSAVGAHYPKRWLPRITLTIQPAIKMPPPTHAHARGRRRQLADEMLKIMQRMMFEVRPRWTLYEAFVDAAKLHGRRTVIIEDARAQPETYGSLLKSVVALARIVTHVSREGETLGVMLPNLSATVALVIGLTAQRRVAAMLNYSAGPHALHAACVAAGIKTVITSRRFIEVARLGAAVRALQGIELVYLEDLRGRLKLADKLWIMRALFSPRSVMPAQDCKATAIVLFTSGSEARSKGVAISHDAMLSNMAQMRAVIDFGPADKFLNALPMYHTYGLVACTLMPLISGTPLFLYTTPLHYKAIPELAYTRDCTYIFGT
ncbi:MAG TPA: AMP-binding protein, partial [Burkholderiales bacterium]|nr:AMP-binding protein [Burkholderiales bacterium]